MTVPAADVRTAAAPAGLTPAQALASAAALAPKIIAAAAETEARTFHINRVTVNAQLTAWRALESIIICTAGSSATLDGQRLARIWRDSTIAMGHMYKAVLDFVGAAYRAALHSAPQNARQ